MAGLILVPLDGSKLAQRALRYAAACARAIDGSMLLLRILTPSPARGEPLVQAALARPELEAAASELRADGLDAETTISSTLWGDVASVITSTARRSSAELIVMSTHGRSGPGRWLYGSVAEAVLRQAPTPVLLVPAICDRPVPAQHTARILLTLDGSALAQTVFGPAGVWAHALDAELILLRVIPPPDTEAAASMFEDRAAEFAAAKSGLDAAAESLRGLGARVRVRTETGSPAATIAAVARDESVDLVAMATHGYSGVARVVLGSVGAETLQRTGLPMLLVRPAVLSSASDVDSPSEQQPDQIGKTSHPVRLLVALDLTDKADAALGPTARIARACGAEVVLLNVFRPSVDMGHLTAGTDKERLEYVRAERRMYLERKAEHLLGVNVTTRVESLPHGEEVEDGIARIARSLEADILVVVSARVSSAAGAILGSFAQGILHASPCPVLVVRSGPGKKSVAHHS